MTFLLWSCVLLSQVALVAGQIFLKHAMSHPHGKPREKPHFFHLFSGISMLTLWFFLWVGLLQKKDLSYIYPFEGISPVLLVLAAQFFLRERLGWKAWAGLLLIAVGAIVVGIS